MCRLCISSFFSRHLLNALFGLLVLAQVKMAYDFGSYLDNPSLSDVDVVIIVREDQQRQESSSNSSQNDMSAHPPNPAAILPGHRLLLHRASPVFAAQLERWHSDAAGDTGTHAGTQAHSPQKPAKPKVELIVSSADDVPSAQLLYRSIYLGAKALEGATQAELLAVLWLADMFEVCGSIEAAGYRLAAVTVDQLDWQTVGGMFTLPDACLQARAMAAPLAACGQKLQQELGDLDVAMRVSKKKQLLLSLPLAALVALLKDDRTRASFEDTVLGVATAWWCERWPGGAQLQQRDEQEQEQHAKQLAAVGRFGQVSPVVLATVARRTQWVSRAVNAEQLYQLIAFSVGGAPYQKTRVLLGEGVVSEHPEWLAPKRPLSCVTEAAFECDVVVEQLRAATGQLLRDVSSGVTLRSVCLYPCEAQFFRGFYWMPKVVIECSDDGSGVQYGVYVLNVDEHMFEIRQDQCIPFCLKVRAVQGAAPPGVAGPARIGYVLDEAVRVGRGCGWPDFWRLGVHKAWSPAAWQGKGLILDGNVVKVLVTVEKAGC